jgi:hypothetical protein
MRNYLRSMKYGMGFAAVIAALVVGMAVFAAGSATAAPVGDKATLGAATVMQPVMLPGAVMVKASSDAAFNRPFFNRPFINNRPFFNRPFINNRPFFARPFFNRPFFARPFFNPFFEEDVFVGD